MAEGRLTPGLIPCKSLGSPNGMELQQRIIAQRGMHEALRFTRIVRPNASTGDAQQGAPQRKIATKEQEAPTAKQILRSSNSCVDG